MMFEFHCPYCGRKNWQIIEDFKMFKKSMITICDLEDGGCDQEFILDYCVEPNCKVRGIDGATKDREKLKARLAGLSV